MLTQTISENRFQEFVNQVKETAKEKEI